MTNKLLKNLFQRIVFYKPQRFYTILSSLIYSRRNGLSKYKHKIEGMLTLPEAVTLHKITHSLKAESKVLEIGCYGGLSTGFMLDGLKNKNCKLYSIDPFELNIESQKRQVRKSCASKSKKLILESLKNKPKHKDVSKMLKNYGFTNFKLIQGYSNNVIKKWTKKLDVLWIDGDHGYNQVKKDFFDWTPFLKKGGILLLHDANRSIFGNWGWKGPTKVAKEFIDKPKWINMKRVDSLVCVTKNH